MNVKSVIKGISRRIRLRGGRGREVRKKSVYRVLLSGGGILRRRNFYEVSAVFLFAGIYNKSQLKDVLTTLTADFDTTYALFIYGKNSYDLRDFKGRINPITANRIVEGIKPTTWSLKEALEYIYNTPKLKSFFNGSDILFLFVENLDEPIILDLKIPEFVVILSERPINISTVSENDLRGKILKKGVFVGLQG